MIQERGFLNRLVDVILYLLLGLLVILCLAPFVHVIAVSFSNFKSVSANQVAFWPIGPHLDNYRFIVRDEAFLRSFGVSTVRVLVGVSLSLIVMLITAYPLSRDNIYMPGRTLFKVLLLFAMLFDGGLIPTFLAYNNLGLIDKFWVLVVPGALNIFLCILIINFFRGISKELYEAAILDGASHFQVLFRVFVPISQPVIATVILFSAVGHWNAWFDGIIYMKKLANWPLQSYLYNLVTTRSLQWQTAGGAQKAGEVFQNATPEGLATTMILVAAIPILLVYPLLQRYFIHGLTLGSIKE
jgi:putative aldouronate transport system permease protein